MDFDRRNEWGGKSPEAAAEQMIDWVAFYRDQLRRAGREDFLYTIWMNEWGAANDREPGANPLENRRNIWALGQNPLDRVEGAATPKGRVGVWYSAQGRRLNKSWAGRFLDRFESLRIRQGLPPPYALHFDLEGCFGLATIGEWWEPALRDPRATSELIDGRRTLAELAREAPAFEPALGIYHPRNSAFKRWATSVDMEATEFAIWDSFWSQARRIWPDVQLSNYALVPASEGHPYPLPPYGTQAEDVRLRFATHASPVLYPIREIFFENGRRSALDHWKRFERGARSTGDSEQDVRELSLAFGKAQIDACVENGAAVVPWIMYPHKEIGLEETHELIDYGLSRGVRQWILWWRDDRDWSSVIRPE